GTRPRRARPSSRPWRRGCGRPAARPAPSDGGGLRRPRRCRPQNGRPVSGRSPVVFLVDVDNTLLDNDRVAADLRRHLEREVGHAGPSEAVDGNVLIYIHKERELDDVERRYPAEHYVLVDDKLRVLTAVKQVWGGRVTTVFARQGHYARDPEALAAYPPADIGIERIGELLEHDLPSLLARSGGSAPTGRHNGSRT